MSPAAQQVRDQAAAVAGTHAFRQPGRAFTYSPPPRSPDGSSTAHAIAAWARHGPDDAVHKQSPGPNINCSPICLLPGAPEPTDTSHKETHDSQGMMRRS